MQNVLIGRSCFSAALKNGRERIGQSAPWKVEYPLRMILALPVLLLQNKSFRDDFFGRNISLQGVLFSIRVVVSLRTRLGENIIPHSTLYVESQPS